MTSTHPRGRHALLVLGGRSELAFRELHGEPVYAHALRAMTEAAGPLLVEVDAADLDRVREDVRRWRLPATPLLREECWEEVRLSPDRGLVAHDAMCPLVTTAFLRSVLEQADARPDTALVAFRPVTDTLKAVVDGRIQQTIDRNALAAVTSPAVVPSRVLTEATAMPPVDDFSVLVSWLRERGEVELVRAPSLGRRVEHARAIHLLEQLDQVGHRVRAGAGHPAGTGPAAGSVAEDRP
jgi:2-C-methyl-D-erythritol 4-phosphate cytidylyltransferase